MKRLTSHRLWTAGVVMLVLLSVFAGTTLACVARGAASALLPQDCCQAHCHHAMTEARATQCCRSHQITVSPALLASSPAKAISFVDSTLSVSPIPPALLQSPEQYGVSVSTAERPPPLLPLYLLHCVLRL
jgi:hypothetical protein